MPTKLLERCCVKIQVMAKDGQRLSQGTGVVVNDGSDYYVLTADHCIYGDDHEFENIGVDDIWVEKQLDYRSPFERIKVLEILDCNPDDDWILLKIEDPQLDCDFLRIFRGEKFMADEKIVFRGYQSFNENEPRTWEGKIIDVANGEFKITLTGKTMDQGGEEAAMLAKGLSGSGVFIVRSDKIYLIGHLKRVIGSIALNDDIKCCACTHFKDKLSAGYIDMGDIEELDIWAKATKRQLTHKDVEEWMSGNVSFFSNLSRKSKVIYDTDERANEQANDRMLDYLEQEYALNSISSYGDLVLKYTQTAEAFEKLVKSSYSRNVNDSNEAKDLIIRLENDFKSHIKDLIKDKSNQKTLELARHKVTLWLLNCSLEFKG